MSDETIFAAALEKADPAERTVFLERVCPDPAARERIDRLLAAHDQAGAFMQRPAVAPEGFPTMTQAPDGDGAAEPDDALTFLSPSARPDALGRIGHYDVLQVLGKGAFGIVFRAFDDVLQRVVAVKVMAPLLAATSPARKRFLREARSSAQVRHENVVQVYEVAEQPLPYIAMEFIPGETLQQRLNRVGPVDAAEVVRVGRQIAEGLAAAHASDLIHRDIKPGNVLIEGGQHRVKITDFGLARAADDASISQSGIIAGTPMYMAPEQALGQKLDRRADLFSLGSVLYQMAAGRPPFRATGTVAVLKRVAEDTPRDIREVIPETPQWLCDIIAKLHAKNPDDRYQSAREVADVLADCEAQLKTSSKLKDYSRIPRGKRAAARPAARKRVTAAVVLLSAVVLAVPAVGVLAYLLLGEPTTSGPGTPGGEPRQVAPAPDGWVPLFNGKDLTGWKTHPDQPGDWRVDGGVLVGSAVPSYLFSENGKFANFHLRVEAKISRGGDGGIFFRAPFSMRQGKTADQLRPAAGYEVELQANPGNLLKTGSVWDAETVGSAPKALWRTKEESLTGADEWLTLELVAEGNRIITKVNGVQTADCLDPLGKYVAGHFALQIYSPQTMVQFRKIEIKELPPTARSATFKNSVGMEFVVVPKGKAWLGGGEDRPGDREVEIPADFYLGKYEVTQEEWEKVMGETPSHFSRTGAGKDEVKDIPDAGLKRFPVENVSWDQCQALAAKLNQREKETGWVYRLPTEAEWEYACRGGPTADKADSAFDFYFAKPTNSLSAKEANIGGGSGLNRTCQVGSYEPNRLGLFDLHGSVWEWCLDDGKAEDGTWEKVSRGGCWTSAQPKFYRATSRITAGPSSRNVLRGLRLARVPAGAPSPEAKTPPADPNGWTVLKPGEMKSEGGATLKLQDDDSVLVSGTHPDKDRYTLTIRDLPAKVHSLRLEVLPHPSLAMNGPGRHADSPFILSGVKTEFVPPGKSDRPGALKLVQAWADHSTGDDATPPLAIDADDNTGWCAEFDKWHFLVVELAEPVAVPAGAALRVTLEFQHDDVRRSLGCFRLSAAPVAQPRPIE